MTKASFWIEDIASSDSEKGEWWRQRSIPYVKWFDCGIFFLIARRSRSRIFLCKILEINIIFLSINSRQQKVLLLISDSCNFVLADIGFIRDSACSCHYVVRFLCFALNLFHFSFDAFLEFGITCLHTECKISFKYRKDQLLLRIFPSIDKLVFFYI